ncbi:unnamed protein product [Symbiodinium microadriaticum]|nr:unnamed protein product [Symbiodinium microadriaticum]
MKDGGIPVGEWFLQDGSCEQRLAREVATQVQALQGQSQLAVASVRQQLEDVYLAGVYSLNHPECFLIQAAQQWRLGVRIYHIPVPKMPFRQMTPEQHEGYLLQTELDTALLILKGTHWPNRQKAQGLWSSLDSFTPALVPKVQEIVQRFQSDLESLCKALYKLMTDTLSEPEVSEVCSNLIETQVLGISPDGQL